MKRGRDRLEALSAAAASLFWQRGFAPTSLADIAAASGVPLGNIYYYFKTKADFARAVADVFVAETEAVLAEIQAEEQEPRRRLVLLVARLSRSLKSRVAHGCPIALCIRDFRLEAPAASDRAAEAFNLLIGFIARELVRTGLRPARALSVARNAVAEWQGGMMLAHALKDAAVLSESFRRMEQLLLGQAKG
jgi:AcrR family transcriptional regulator